MASGGFGVWMRCVRQNDEKINLKADINIILSSLAGVFPFTSFSAFQRQAPRRPAWCPEAIPKSFLKA